MRKETSRKKGDRRYDSYGPWVLMVEASGYIMARRPGCTPFVKSVKEWEAMPDVEQR